MALLLLGIGACGDDDGGGGALGASDAGARAGGGGRDGIEECSLLEPAEIEAQLGEVGAVADGDEDVVGGCLWEIGANGDSVSLLVLPHRPSQSLEDAVTGDGVDIDLTPVAGVGDEALLDDSESFPFLFFRSDDVFVSMSAYVADVAGVSDKLVALAQQVDDRL